jgi:hypothetical protein
MIGRALLNILADSSPSSVLYTHHAAAISCASSGHRHGKVESFHEAQT